MRPGTRRSSFVDADSADDYFESHYLPMLAGWPEHDRRAVQGRFGRTVALVTGPAGAPDLVLLHGRSMPSPSWAPLIGELAAHYRVHAIDTLGEPGLSHNDGVPLRRREDYVTWLGETLDALGLERVHLAGFSFGGWLAARFAVSRPARLKSLTLLDPAQVFAPFSLQWLLQCARPFFAPDRPTITRLFDWTGRGRGGHRELVDLATAGMLSYRIRTPEALRIPGRQLAALKVPAQQLIAEHTVVHDPRRALRSAARINPAVTSHLIPGATHFLLHDQPQLVAELMRELIDRVEEALVAQRE